MAKHAAAVHEAGHIVAAHLMGLSSESVRVTEDGDDQVHINSGEHTGAAKLMMIMDVCPEFFQLSRRFDKEATTDLPGVFV